MPGRMRAFTSETFRSLRTRNFRLFFVGQAVSQVGNWLTLVAQTLLVLELTDSGVALGALAAAQFGPVLVLGPWAGLVADRHDKRRLLLAVQTLAMGQSFVLAGLAFAGDPPVWAIDAVAVLGGMTMAFDNPARRAFVVEMVGEDDASNAVSLNSALMTGSRVVGPALAGVLVSTLGFGWAFAIDGVSYVAVLVALARMRPAELRRPPPARRGAGQIREGLRYIRSVPELRVPLTMMAVVGTLSYNFQTVFPLFTTRDLEGGINAFTALFALVSLGSLAGALAVARRRTISVRAVAWSAVAYGLAMAAMAVTPVLAVALAVGVGLGLASISFLTASTAIVQIESAPEMRGRVLALQAMLFLGTTPIGGPIVGTVAEHAGARWAIGLGAVAALAAGAWGLTVRNVSGAGPTVAVVPDEAAVPP